MDISMETASEGDGGKRPGNVWKEVILHSLSKNQYSRGKCTDMPLDK